MSLAYANLGRVAAPEQRACGEWVNTTTYLNTEYYVDTVIRNRDGYKCVSQTGSCVGIDPLTDTTGTYWEKYVLGGEDGIINSDSIVNFEDYTATTPIPDITTSTNNIKTDSKISILFQYIKSALLKLKELVDLKFDKNNIVSSTTITEIGKIMDGKTSSEEFSKINGYINTIYKDLLRQGIKPSATKIIEVGAGKTFTSLVQAINTLVEDEACIIKLYEGVYDIASEIAPTEFGLMIPNNCYVIGIGKKENIIVVANLTTPNYKFSPVNLTKNCGLFNLNIASNNCRYTIHDDFDVQESHSKRIIDNCIIQGSNHEVEWCYGAGIKGGSTLEINNTMFVNNTDSIPFSIHNMTNAHEESVVILRNCRFYSKNDFTYGIRLSSVNNYESSTLVNKVKVYIENCDNASVMFDTEDGIAINVFQVITPDILCFASRNGQIYSFADNIRAYNMIFEAYPYDSSIVSGIPVFKDLPCKVAKPVGKGSQLVDGIAISSYVNSDNIIQVAKKGYFQDSKLGLDISTVPAGKLLNFVPSSGELTWSDTRDFNTLGYVTNFSQIYLFGK